MFGISISCHSDSRTSPASNGGSTGPGGKGGSGGRATGGNTGQGGTAGPMGGKTSGGSTAVGGTTVQDAAASEDGSPDADAAWRSDGDWGGALDGWIPSQCEKMIYDGETVGLTDSWAIPASSTLSETTLFSKSGTTSMFVDLAWSADYWGGAWGWNFPELDASQSKNLSFWIRTAAGKQPWLYFCLNGASPSCTSADKWGVPAMTPEWQQVVVPLTAFPGLDTKKIFSLKLDTHALKGQTSVQYYVDDVCFGK